MAGCSALTGLTHTRELLMLLRVRQSMQGNFTVVSNMILDRPSVGYCGFKAGDIVLKRGGPSDPDVRFV